MVHWLRAHPMDVIHTHGSKAGVLGRLAASKAGVPVIVHTVHGWGHHARQHPLVHGFYVAAERRAALVTDRLIVVADSDRERGLVDGIGTPNLYQTVRPGIDLPRFRDVAADPCAAKAALGLPPNALVVGTVSRLAAQKAPLDFVRMAAIVHARRPDVHFVFVGGGPLAGIVADAVCAAGLTNVVHLLGYREDVPQLLRALDVFVLNSLWEGLPAVFAQAMCAALPLVATHAGGASEAIVEGENGFLTAPGDPDALAARVLSLLDDPNLRRKMGARGLSLVDPLFSEERMVHQIEALYLRLVHEKGLLAPDPLSPAPPPDYSLRLPTTLHRRQRLPYE
jgi:glycosyltransferase involved in cell wall biosynthesis